MVRSPACAGTLDASQSVVCAVMPCVRMVCSCAYAGACVGMCGHAGCFATRGLHKRGNAQTGHQAHAHVCAMNTQTPLSRSLEVFHCHVLATNAVDTPESQGHCRPHLRPRRGRVCGASLADTLPPVPLPPLLPIVAVAVAGVDAGGGAAAAARCASSAIVSSTELQLVALVSEMGCKPSRSSSSSP